MKKLAYIPPEYVLSAIYGKTSRQTGLSEKRRDEVIAAAIYACFCNQEFGTRFKLPADYRKADLKEDAEGIDITLINGNNSRRKRIQIKGVYLPRSIERRKKHSTRGHARVTGFKSQRFIKRDSAMLTKMMQGELEKIHHDYSGLILIIHVIADLANQTSLEIAIRNSQKVVNRLKAREVWFLRNIPVRAIHGKMTMLNSHAFNLLKLAPDKHTYGFSFAL